MTDLRQMQEALRGMVHRVREASDGIVMSSGEIATGSMDLSARTERAAASRRLHEIWSRPWRPAT